MVCIRTVTQIYFTLIRPIFFHVKFDRVKLGWSIVYIEGLQVIVSKKVLFFFLRNKSDASRKYPAKIFLHRSTCTEKLFVEASETQEKHSHGNTVFTSRMEIIMDPDQLASKKPVD